MCTTRLERKKTARTPELRAFLAVLASSNCQSRDYTARGGADAVASYLISNSHQLDNFIKKTKLGPATGNIDGRDFEVYVTGTEHEFIIESIAYTPDGSQEASRVYLTMKELNLLDHAIFADQIINSGNNITINGNIGTNGAYINFGNGIDINGNITLGVNASPSDLSSAEAHLTGDNMVNKLSVPIVFPAINPADFPPIIPNNTININTANYTANMVDGKLKSSINKIELSGNQEFYVHGGGQVHLYVTEKISAGGTTQIRTDSNTMLYLYYDKSDLIIFNGSPDSNVNIYAPTATIKFNGGGTGSMNGSFICKIFEGTNSNNSVLTQGTGNMSDLVVEGVAGYYRAVWSD